MKTECTFIHVGKCGGTYISEQFPMFRHVHMGRPMYDENTKYILWIRNPLSRFVSAFNHAVNLINFDVSGYDFDSLYSNPDTPYYRLPNKIKNKLETGKVFGEWSTGEEYEELVKFFGTANHLAESLTSRNRALRHRAKKLMENCEVEHLYKGIGWYLDNGRFVKKYHAKFLFVGRQEYMVEDVKKLSGRLNIQAPANKRVRKNLNATNPHLSPQAVKNLLKFYKSSDYKALSVLYKYHLINEETYCLYLSL